MGLFKKKEFKKLDYTEVPENPEMESSQTVETFKQNSPEQIQQRPISMPATITVEEYNHLIDALQAMYDLNFRTFEMVDHLHRRFK